MSGTVCLVGAGPGAAALLTVRAARLLGEAEIVFHDARSRPLGQPFNRISASS